MLDKLEAGQAAQMTFEDGEDVDATMKVLTKATRVRSVQVKKEQYMDKNGKQVVSVYLAGARQQTRARKKSEGASGLRP